MDNDHDRNIRSTPSLAIGQSEKLLFRTVRYADATQN